VLRWGVGGILRWRDLPPHSRCSALLYSAQLYPALSYIKTGLRRRTPLEKGRRYSPYSTVPTATYCYLLLTTDRTRCAVLQHRAALLHCIGNPAVPLLRPDGYLYVGTYHLTLVRRPGNTIIMQRGRLHDDATAAPFHRVTNIPL
jgi:hypothetical protein